MIWPICAKFRKEVFPLVCFEVDSATRWSTSMDEAIRENQIRYVYTICDRIGVIKFC